MAKFKSRGIRVASKVQEKKILDVAERLKKNPSIVLPECGKKCKVCFFKSMQKKIEKVKEAVNDEKKLSKLANKKDFVSAIAGTILLTFSKKIPYFATKNVGRETIVYAQRGKADEQYLIAAQHIDEPSLRLLGFINIAQKKKLYVYVTDEKTICMGKDSTPPNEFLDFISKKFGWKDWTCSHEGTCIKIKWIPSGKEIKICEGCAKGNTILRMTKYYYTPYLEKEFKAEVIGEMIHCGERCEVCVIKEVKEKKMDDSFYIQGKIGDKEFIENWRKKVRWNIEKIKEGILIIDGTCYGSNIDTIIKKIKPNKWEEIGLRYMLQKLEKPLFISDATPNKILSAHWDEYGKEIVKKIAGKEGERIFEEGKRRHYSPSQVLEKAYDFQQKKKILQELPTYNKLPPLASFADGIARAYKIKGIEGAIKKIHSEKMDTKKKAIAYAFLLAMRKAKSEAWKYSDMEKEFGEHLAPFADKLLNEKGKEYEKALQDLITLSGSTKKIGG
ncbi:MAG: hypothetical protein FE048_01565 [Thermoplasmata archaeon]|nr:MAG: hypothetical protein FE048_01565 [Thermoplasmata archaeon]